MVTVNRRVLEPLEVATASVLVMAPDLPRQSSVASMGPPSPGASRHGCAGSFATVQPHAGCTPCTITAEAEVLVTQKVMTALAAPS